jgi:hypothetical protein
MLAYSLIKFKAYLSKYMVYIIIAVIAMIGLVLISNMDNISEKLGFETKATLKTQVVSQKAVIAQAVQTNKDLVKELDNEKESTDATVDVLTGKYFQDMKLDEDMDEIRAEKAKVISKVMKTKLKPSFKSTEKPLESISDEKTEYTSSEVNEVSKANIEAIWKAFEKVEVTA